MILTFNPKIMRIERVTLNAAREAWKAAQAAWHGALTLPDIDFSQLFCGRKSVMWRELTGYIAARINQANGL